jgi:hypothetical protein
MLFLSSNSLKEERDLDKLSLIKNDNNFIFSLFYSLKSLINKVNILLIQT